MNNYLIALDLGTSSIGYVAFSLDENEQPNGLLDAGVRVFSDGRDPKTKEPLAVQRRIARGIRRTRDRSQNRVRRLVRELIQCQLLPEDEAARKKVFDEVSPYRARRDAAKDRVDAHTLGRALFHLGRRRGFKSNRLSDEAEDTDFKNKITTLRKTLGDRTLGEYLCEKYESNLALTLAKPRRPNEQQPVRFRGGETDFYADRQMYIDEFKCIRQTQGNMRLTDSQWELLQETIFWQYPLKPVPKGKCRFYLEEDRAHLDLPISHRFRIYQEVNSLRYVSEGLEHALSERQRNYLYQLLDTQKSVGFKALLKKKDEHGSPYFPSDAIFNLDVGSRAGRLVGNGVMFNLRKPDYLGDLADQFDESELNNIIHFLIEPTKTKNDKSVILEQEEVAQWLRLKAPKLTDEQIHKLNSYHFKRGTASVSRKFMEAINPIMKETGKVYSEAVAQLTDAEGRQLHHSYFPKENECTHLPYYGEAMPESVWGKQPESDKNKTVAERDNDAYEHGKIANPTVHIALNQLRYVVNRLIDRLGQKPTKIHIELTRDLKNSKKARDEINKKITQNRKENDRIRDFLQEEFNITNPHSGDLQKIKLWEELGKQGARFSVFSGKPISATKLFSGEVEIEHIIPFSRCYDDGMNNKTLAFREENQFKGNHTPAEAWGGDQTVYENILKRALRSFKQGSKYNRFKEGAFESFYGDGTNGTMIARQLNDTKYISKKARQYLSCICPENKIVSVNGMMTAVLRDVWQLNNFKNRAEGNYREDHRHHIVDAFVVGLTSRRLIQRLNTKREHVEQNHKDLYHFLKAHVADIPHLKKELSQLLNSVSASYKRDHSKTGSMFNDTAYGITTGRDGLQYCITRKALSELNADKIFQIRDDRLKGKILEYLTGSHDVHDKKHLLQYLSDTEIPKRLAEFSKVSGVKKTRILIQNNSVSLISSAPYKGYTKNSYAYCDVWQVPTKKDKATGQWKWKYQGDFVGYDDIKNRTLKPDAGRPRPAAKKLMRLFKNDCVQLIDKNTGETSLKRVAGYKAQRNKLDLRPNLRAVDDDRKFESINKIFANNTVHKK